LNNILGLDEIRDGRDEVVEDISATAPQQLEREAR
jgi:hypothetical protein